MIYVNLSGNCGLEFQFKVDIKNFISNFLGKIILKMFFVTKCLQLDQAQKVKNDTKWIEAESLTSFVPLRVKSCPYLLLPICSRLIRV